MTHNTHTNQQQHIHHKTTQNHRTHNTHTTATAPSVAILDQGFECCCCASMYFRVRPDGRVPSAGGEAPPSDCIVLGGLPGHMTKEQFEAMISTFGTMTSSYFMPARDPGAEASAWCRFSSIDEAIRVVEDLNKNQGMSELLRLRVKFAASVAASGAASGAAAESGTPVVPGDLRGDIVFVSDLPGGMSKEQLKDVFSCYGVTSFRMMPEKTASGKAEALIKFADIDDATWFEENLNDNIPEGLEQPIKCIFARTPSYEPMRAGGNGGARSQPYAAAGKKGMSCGSSGGEAMGGGCSGMSEGMSKEQRSRGMSGRDSGSQSGSEGQSGGRDDSTSRSEGKSGGYSGGKGKGQSSGYSSGKEGGKNGKKGSGPKLPRIGRKQAREQLAEAIHTSSELTKSLGRLWDDLFPR